MAIVNTRKTFSYLVTGFLSLFLFVGSTNHAQAAYAPPPPVGTLTANNQTNLTLNASNTANFAWTSSGGSTYSSYFTVNTPDSCGNQAGHQYPWQANTSSGFAVVTLSACQAGHSYTYTYVVTSSQLQQFQASVTLSVTPSPTGSMNILDYGAKCDGSTDDTAAVQSAINAARNSSDGATIIIPDTGNGCVISQLDITNAQSKMRIIGESSKNGRQSYLLCKELSADSGTCMDFSGTDSVNIENLQIVGGTSTSNAPRILVLLGKAYDSGGNLHNGSEIVWESVTITASNGSDYGIYSLGGEDWNCSHCYVASNGIAGLVLSSNNSAHITSNYVSLLSPPVSMTDVHFVGSAFSTAANTPSAVLLDPTPGHSSVMDIGFTATYGHISGRAFITDTGSGALIQGLHFTEMRVEGYGTSPISAFGIFNNVVQQITVDSDFSNTQPNGPPQLQFNNTTNGQYSVIGADIKLRPGDSQANYPAIVVQCAQTTHGVVIHPYEAYGGGPSQSNCPGSTTIW